MIVLSTNIGDKKEIDWKGKKVTTGIFKYPTDEGIFLNVEEVKGDTICDREHHGGVDQAVYAYSVKHYDYFKELHPDLDWELGMFGENLTLTDIEETEIHVGDTFELGEVVIEATKARFPCMKLGVRFNNMKIVKQFWNTTKCGVYFKVLKTGVVKKGDEFKLLKSDTSQPTIADLYINKRTKKFS
ncbi:MOSC domain-containing protein [Tenacibaculum sp. M341]|uniref:MOSC domain-containing protein n=1 Tax=Tenacibaculum sp. M341 TaxID=2530339 RepID=UPI00104B9425|nr:MOSC domain-containing protein [Tenacibaculum sp. M341]TCI94295.1 MOSC domain-containing protein [Tenacibaculum sp. M341]